MFFISGINSILPFIVYISLVWICMIVGYVGHLKPFAEKQDILSINTGQNDIFLIDRNYIIDPQRNISFINNTHKNLRKPGITPAQKMKHFAIFVHSIKIRADQSPVIDACLNEAHFRGPPEI